VLNRILFLAAHPDDEVLGCGGTIAKLSKQGHEVFVAILGEGVTSRFTTRELANDKLLADLRTCSQDVANLLGVKELFQYDLPDNRFDTIPLLDIVKRIEGLIDDLSPDVVFTQHGGDLNIDHQLLFRATLTATRPTKDCPVRELYAYPVASSSEWGFGRLEPLFTANTYVDISQTLDVKLAAMKRYEGESREFPHPRSPEALRAIALQFGSTAGLAAAEAFELIRAVNPAF
jgi:LmbE family N-acetylglucosaminyl deacetylase